MRKMLLCLFAVLAATVTLAATHSVDMGNQECVTCHADGDIVNNPGVVKEFNQSLHNYAGVMCGSCHGDENDFQPRPRKVACAPCHADQVALTKSNLPCERCHVVHTFTVHTTR